MKSVGHDIFGLMGAHLTRSFVACMTVMALLALGGCSDAFDQSGPADILLEGQLCVPATQGCPRLKTLRRTNDLGANRVDFRLTNNGAAAEISVIAVLRPNAEPDAGIFDVGLPDKGTPTEEVDAGPTDSLTGVVRRYTLAAGESVSDRFVPEEILTVSTFGLILECDDCSATLDYILATAPLECRIDNDCASTWVCSRADGRCVECLADSDCSKTQTCDLSNQQCTPVDAGGCSTSPTQTPTPFPALLVLIAAMGWALKRRFAPARRSGARRPHPAILITLSAMAILALDARQADAAPPNASVQLGVGPRLLTGKLGDATLRGIGLKVSQEVRGRYVGGQLTLGTSYFVTTQDAPPLSHELQLYSVAIGPQFYLPIGPVELTLGADLRHIGLITNSLVKLSGPEINYIATGGTLQARYRFGGLAVMLDGGYHPVFGLDSSIFSMNLSVGLATD